MTQAASIFESERFSDRTLIESIVQSYYIVDYGYIKTVNPDKTVDVVHAKQLKTIAGQNLNATITKKVEMLTMSGSGFSIQFDYNKGDKVLLLGLKEYIPSVNDVTGSTETTSYMHYSRETMKALPLCVFNNDAKAVIKIEKGTIDIKGDKIKMQDGGKNAARKGDQVKVTIPAGSFVVAVAGQATGTLNPSPIDVTGTIQEGSSSVEIGD